MAATLSPVTPVLLLDISGGDSVVTEIHIAAPRERVFKALTDQGELMRWFTELAPPHPSLGDGRPSWRRLPVLY